MAWLYALDAYEGGLPTADQLATVADAAEVGERQATTSVAFGCVPAQPASD